MTNIEEYNVKEVGGVHIKGPMKWIVIVLGPNHHCKEIDSLLSNKEGFKNVNIIVVLIKANNKTVHQAGATHLDNIQQPEIDSITRKLNELAKQTPEGYMVAIDQRAFDGRDPVTGAALDGSKSQIGGIGNKSSSDNQTAIQGQLMKM